MNHVTPGTFRAALLLLAMAALFVAIGSLFGMVGAAVALALAVVIGFWSFWESGQAVLAASGARELTTGKKDRAILEIVSMLAERTGIPMPRVYELKEAQPNAMASRPQPATRRTDSYHRPTQADAAG